MPLLPEMAWIRSRRISQSSRASPGELNGAVKSLQAAFHVDHRAALFGKAGAGQDDVGELGGGIRQNVRRDERRRVARDPIAKPAPAMSSPSAITALNGAGLDASLHFSKLPGCDAQQLRARCVRVAVAAEQKSSPSPVCGTISIDSVPARVARRRGEPQLFVRHASRSDDGDFAGERTFSSLPRPARTPDPMRSSRAVCPASRPG